MSQERDRVAAVLPAYEVGEEIGRGAYGVVAAVHRRLRRDVAIKALNERFCAIAGMRSRFANEARVLAGFDHPHIVPVHDYVEEPDVCALVMDRLSDFHSLRAPGLSERDE